MTQPPPPPRAHAHARRASPHKKNSTAQHTRARTRTRTDLVEQVEGRGVAALDRKDERERDERLLPAAQLLDAHRLAGAAEGDAHLDARVLFERAAAAGRRKSLSSRL